MGLRLDARRLGKENSSVCPRCKNKDGHKLTTQLLARLAQEFFVWGSVHKCSYGAAPRIQFNDRRETDIKLPRSLRTDVTIFEEELGIGFFYYGPRLWMVGEIEPLKELLEEATRSIIVDRIISEYDTKILTSRDYFYRVRSNLTDPSSISEYDSPPPNRDKGRLTSIRHSTLHPIFKPVCTNAALQ